jgi:hypothetical protein
VLLAVDGQKSYHIVAFSILIPSACTDGTTDAQVQRKKDSTKDTSYATSITLVATRENSASYP